MSETNPNGKKRNILFKVVPIIDRHLGFIDKKIGESPHYEHGESCNRLSKSPLLGLDMLNLIEEIYKQIEDNWKDAGSRQMSNENWRFKLNSKISEDSKSSEVKLERAIARVFKASPSERDYWANQVPTASGLVPPHNDKHRNVDLIHECREGEYEFIELKVKSNTPLYAAMEILLYGLLYIFRRLNEQSQVALIESEATKKQLDLLRAAKIHLQVLAPSEYYKDYKLQWLEKKTREGLRQMAKNLNLPFRMDFEFQHMPFVTTGKSQQEIADPLVEAMLRNRKPVYRLS